MFEFLRKKRNKPPPAHEMGQKLGASTAEAIETYLNHRLPEVSRNLLSAFQQRLATIHDDPDHAPEEVAKVEWRIFKERLDTFSAHMLQETRDALRKWLDVAAEIGVLHEVNHVIEIRINEASRALMNESVVMLSEVCAALEKKT